MATRTTSAGGTRLRVLVVGPGARTPGGIWSVTRTLLESDLGRRLELRHVSTHRDGDVLDKLRAAASGLARIAATLAHGRADVVWAHVSAGAAFWRKSLVLLVARAFGVPFVLHVHGSRFAVWYDRARPVERALARRVLQACDLVVTLSPTWEERLQEVTSCRTTAIMNPVALPPARDGAARVPGRVVCLGRLGERKGSRVLVRAIALLRDRGVEAGLVLAGDGDPAPVEDEARRLAVADRVEVRSWIDPDEVGRLLDSAAVFALPSQNEGLPVALLEALAHELPVVVTPVGGIPDLVRDGEHGLMVRPDDPEGLADAIELLLAEPGEAARLARAGRAQVERRCAVPVVVDQLEDALRHVATRHRRRRRAL